MSAHSGSSPNELPAAIVHPTRPELVWRRPDGALARAAIDAPRRALRLLEPAPEALAFVLGDAPTAQGQVVVGQRAGALELRRWEDLELRARVNLSGATGRWSHLTVCPRADLIVGADGAGALHVLQMKEGVRGRVEPAREVSHVAALALSPRGRGVAALLTGPRRGMVRVWSARGPRLRVHIEALDQRAVPGPHRQLAGVIGDVRWGPGGELLYAYVSAGQAPASWPGWRGRITCHDVVDGRLVWATQIDAEVTGDVRPLEVLDAPRGVPATLWIDAAGRRLWVGTAAGTIVELDARDGALEEVTAGGGLAPASCLLVGQARRWAITPRGGWLPW